MVTSRSLGVSEIDRSINSRVITTRIDDRYFVGSSNVQIRTLNSMKLAYPFLEDSVDEGNDRRSIQE